MGNGDHMQRVNYLIHDSLYSSHENSKIERRVRERDQISGEVGNLERAIDATNKLRDMFKMPN